VNNTVFFFFLFYRFVDVYLFHKLTAGCQFFFATIEAPKRGRSTEQQQKKFLEQNPHARLIPRFAHHRCVVERVIGRMKQSSSFIAGPIYESQHDKLSSVLLIVSGLVNRQLESNPNLFVQKQ
jgi:hypothetical protein